MKKTVQLIFLFLANIILLAHAVIPHHHHDLFNTSNQVCLHEHFEKNHCQHVESKHLNDENVKFNSCHLDQDYTRLVNSQRSFHSFESNSEDELDTDFQVFKLFLPPNNLIDLEPKSALLPFSTKPYSRTYYPDLIAQSIGLRAPPFYC